jgi:hypothetical protein
MELKLRAGNLSTHLPFFPIGMSVIKAKTGPDYWSQE